MKIAMDYNVNELAQKGFVVLTFDQSFMGDSRGEVRHVSSPIYLQRISVPR